MLSKFRRPTEVEHDQPVSHAAPVIQKMPWLPDIPVITVSPGNGVSAGAPSGMWVDAFIPDRAGHLYVRGWAFDSRGSITSIALVSPSGHRQELTDRVVHSRRDVGQAFPSVFRTAMFDDAGFMTVVPVAAAESATDGWMVEARVFDGSIVRHRVGERLSEPRHAREAIIEDMGRVSGRALERLCDQLQPLLNTLQESLAPAEIDEVLSCGAPPADPHVSVVVPLYRRLDFVEYQLASFATDPDFRETDLIYVLDSPDDATHLRSLAPRLHALYGVPFRVVFLRRNSGFSGANNAGASVARAPLLLLMNSDVFPVGNGWLSRFATSHLESANAGVSGPKLLFEDESIQHAGMYFSRVPGSDEWENLHYFKGLHRSLPAANVARRVPAVTGACMLLNTELYQSLGGLNGQYVLGDFEDSDLCLRLNERGFAHWYHPSIELYHLEAQSHWGATRQPYSRYNRRLHSALWGEQMAKVMRQY